MNDTICVQVMTPGEATANFNVTIYELPSSCQRIVVRFSSGQEVPDVRGFTKDDAQEFVGVATNAFKSIIVA